MSMCPLCRDDEPWNGQIDKFVEMLDDHERRDNLLIAIRAILTYEKFDPHMRMMIYEDLKKWYTPDPEPDDGKGIWDGTK